MFSKLIHLYLITDLTQKGCFSNGPAAYRLLCTECFIQLDREQDIASSRETQVNAPCENCGADSVVRKRYECERHGEFEIEHSKIPDLIKCAFCGSRKVKDLGFV